MEIFIWINMGDVERLISYTKHQGRGYDNFNFIEINQLCFTSLRWKSHPCLSKTCFNGERSGTFCAIPALSQFVVTDTADAGRWRAHARLRRWSWCKHTTWICMYMYPVTIQTHSFVIFENIRFSREIKRCIYTGKTNSTTARLIPISTCCKEDRV